MSLTHQSSLPEKEEKRSHANYFTQMRIEFCQKMINDWYGRKLPVIMEGPVRQRINSLKEPKWKNNLFPSKIYGIHFFDKDRLENS